MTKSSQIRFYNGRCGFLVCPQLRPEVTTVCLALLYDVEGSAINISSIIIVTKEIPLVYGFSLG